MQALSLVLVVAMGLGLVYGDATFNNSAAALCALPGCSFSDPRIWINQTRPTTFANVIIYYTSFSNPITITVTEGNAFENMTLYGSVTLSVTQSLLISNLQVSADATLDISVQGSVKTTGTATFLSSDLEVEDSGHYIHDGDPMIPNSFLLDQRSTMTAIDLALISLSGSNLPQLLGAVTFGPKTTFIGNAYFQSSTSPAINSIAFPNTPLVDTLSFSGLSVTFSKGLTCRNILTDKSSVTIFGNAVLQNVNISQNSNVYVRTANAQLDNISGKGLLFIQTSTIKFSGNGEALSQVILAGAVNATAYDITFKQISFTNGEYNEPPNINFLVSNYVQFSGSYNIPGSISATNAQLVLNGAITLSGNISIVSSTVTVNGMLTTGSNIYLQQINPDAAPTYLQLNGTLNVPSVFIQTGCSLRSTGNSSTISVISGDVINNGSILVSPNFPLQVEGSYTQFENTSLTAFLDPETSSEIALEVGESVYLAGDIFYDVTTNYSSKGVQFVIISATGEINGTFAMLPTSVSDLVVESTITYSTHEITLIMFKDLESPSILKWWMVFLIVVGSIAACLVASHFIILAMRHQHNQYNPLAT